MEFAARDWTCTKTQKSGHIALVDAEATAIKCADNQQLLNEHFWTGNLRTLQKNDLGGQCQGDLWSFLEDR